MVVDDAYLGEIIVTNQSVTVLRWNLNRLCNMLGSGFLDTVDSAISSLAILEDYKDGFGSRTGNLCDSRMEYSIVQDHINWAASYVQKL